MIHGHKNNEQHSIGALAALVALTVALLLFNLPPGHPVKNSLSQHLLKSGPGKVAPAGDRPAIANTTAGPEQGAQPQHKLILPVSYRNKK